MAYDVAIVLGSVVMAFIFAYLGANIKGKHFALQTLFIFAALILMINTAGFMGEVAIVDGSSPSMVVIDGPGQSDDRLYVAYFNSTTGNLLVSNSSDGAQTWHTQIAHTLDDRTFSSIDLVENNIVVITWIFYIAIAYYIIFYLWEIFQAFGNNKRARPGMTGD
jgi:tellurite resistance protein TehA-like permease